MSSQPRRRSGTTIRWSTCARRRRRRSYVHPAVAAATLLPGQAKRTMLHTLRALRLSTRTYARPSRSSSRRVHERLGTRARRDRAVSARAKISVRGGLSHQTRACSRALASPRAALARTPLTTRSISYARSTWRVRPRTHGARALPRGGARRAAAGPRARRRRHARGRRPPRRRSDGFALPSPSRASSESGSEALATRPAQPSPSLTP